jgi:hypothetical protein
MAAMKTLIEQLESHGHGISPLRDKLTAAIGELVGKVRDWLSEPEKLSLLQISEESLEYTQPGLGRFHTSGLTITTDTVKIWLRPLGLEQVDGTQACRVEFWSAEEGFTLVHLLDTGDSWRLYEEGKPKEAWPVLDAELFEKMMVRLVKA